MVKWDEVGELHGSQILRALLALVRSFHFALRAMGKHKDLREALTGSDLCSEKIILATEGTMHCGRGCGGEEGQSGGSCVVIQGEVGTAWERAVGVKRREVDRLEVHLGERRGERLDAKR